MVRSLLRNILKASGNSQLLKTAETMKFEFGQDVLQSLLDATSSDSQFEQYLKKTELGRNFRFG